jgi:ribokinase
MNRVLVSGLVNIETTLKIEGFPIEYSPVLYPFGGVSSTVSGVGMNLALALRTLGDGVIFQTLLGMDPAGDLALAGIRAAGLGAEYVLRPMPATAQSVILYDSSGRRQIHVDLKDIQERRYPAETFQSALNGMDAALLCNINFNRNLLSIAKARGVPVFTDVHVLGDPDDAYNADYMAAATVLFLSDEGLWAPPAEAARELLSLYGCRIVVIGRGAKGALLCERGAEPVAVAAVTTRPVVSTIGAGDALFSAFTHYLLSGMKPQAALEQAVVFASWKIGETGAAKGFLPSNELESLYASIDKGART